MRVKLDPEKIRELYTAGLSMHEVARGMRTSINALYANWPADLPRRSQGSHLATNKVVVVNDTQTPEAIVAKLMQVVDPDDLVDVADLLMLELK